MRRKFLTLLLSSVFLVVMFGSLFHLSMGMNMVAGESGCPFMSAEENLCQMSVLEHLGLWQSNFQSILIPLASFLGLLLAAATLITLAPNLLFSWQKLLSRLTILVKQRLSLTVPNHALQEMFSSGILNPKLF